MSTSSIAAAAVASQQSQLQMAMQTAMLKTEFKQDMALVQMIAEATESAAPAASAPPGTGKQLDISV
ncbi:MAG: putative motility protein [Parvibaculum sp.]